MRIGNGIYTREPCLIMHARAKEKRYLCTVSGMTYSTIFPKAWLKKVVLNLRPFSYELFTLQCSILSHFGCACLCISNLKRMCHNAHFEVAPKQRLTPSYLPESGAFTV